MDKDIKESKRLINANKNNIRELENRVDKGAAYELIKLMYNELGTPPNRKQWREYKHRIGTILNPEDFIIYYDILYEDALSEALNLNYDGDYKKEDILICLKYIANKYDLNFITPNFYNDFINQNWYDSFPSVEDVGKYKHLINSDSKIDVRYLNISKENKNSNYHDNYHSVRENKVRTLTLYKINKIFSDKNVKVEKAVYDPVTDDKIGIVDIFIEDLNIIIECKGSHNSNLKKGIGQALSYSYSGYDTYLSTHSYYIPPYVIYACLNSNIGLIGVTKDDMDILFNNYRDYALTISI